MVVYPILSHYIPHLIAWYPHKICACVFWFLSVDKFHPCWLTAASSIVWNLYLHYIQISHCVEQYFPNFLVANLGLIPLHPILGQTHIHPAMQCPPSCCLNRFIISSNYMAKPHGLPGLPTSVRANQDVDDDDDEDGMDTCSMEVPMVYYISYVNPKRRPNSRTVFLPSRSLVNTISSVLF